MFIYSPKPSISSILFRFAQPNIEHFYTKRETSNTTDTGGSRQQWWSFFKPRPKYRNTPTQHIPTLLGASCCVRLATVLRCVATCWVLLAQVRKWSNLSQQHPTRRNMSQQGGQTHTTCCAQQRCDMLSWQMLRSFGRGLQESETHWVQVTSKRI